MYVDMESGALGGQNTLQRKKCGVVRELVTIADFFFMYVHCSIFLYNRFTIINITRRYEQNDFNISITYFIA